MLNLVYALIKLIFSLVTCVSFKPFKLWNLQDQINGRSRIVVEVSVVKLEVEIPRRDTALLHHAQI